MSGLHNLPPMTTLKSFNSQSAPYPVNNVNTCSRVVMDWKGYGITSGKILTFEMQKASKNLSEQNRSPG